MSEQPIQSEDRRVFERELLFGEAGETIGVLLAELGISQWELAERVSRSESWVSRIVGAAENVTLRTLADVGIALGLRFHLAAEELPDRGEGPGAENGALPAWVARGVPRS